MLGNILHYNKGHIITYKIKEKRTISKYFNNIKRMISKLAGNKDIIIDGIYTIDNISYWICRTFDQYIKKSYNEFYCYKTIKDITCLGIFNSKDMKILDNIDFNGKKYTKFFCSPRKPVTENCITMRTIMKYMSLFVLSVIIYFQ